MASGDGGPALAAEFNSPHGVAVDNNGNLYVADVNNNRVRKVSTSGSITTVAGNGTAGFKGDGGSATNAELNGPTGVAVDGAGNLYIADQSNDRVRKVRVNGIISTVAGVGTDGHSGDGGPATHAQMERPAGIAVDAVGDLFVSEGGDFCTGFVREVEPNGIITTFAEMADQPRVRRSTRWL